jgi:hypothetical protein
MSELPHGVYRSDGAEGAFAVKSLLVRVMVEGGYSRVDIITQFEIPTDYTEPHALFLLPMRNLGRFKQLTVLVNGAQLQGRIVPAAQLFPSLQSVQKDAVSTSTEKASSTRRKHEEKADASDDDERSPSLGAASSTKRKEDERSSESDGLPEHTADDAEIMGQFFKASSRDILVGDVERVTPGSVIAILCSLTTTLQTTKDSFGHPCWEFTFPFSACGMFEPDEFVCDIRSSEHIQRVWSSTQSLQPILSRESAFIRLRKGDFAFPRKHKVIIRYRTGSPIRSMMADPLTMALALLFVAFFVYYLYARFHERKEDVLSGLHSKSSRWAQPRP